MQPDPDAGSAPIAQILAAAAAECDRALVDYQAGLLDERELRRELQKCGLVMREDEVWLLELRTQRWWRYDGIELLPGR